MSRRDEIHRRLREIDVERARLREELEQVELGDQCCGYLKRLVEADVVQPSLENIEPTFKDEVLRWLKRQEIKSRELTIKGWVVSTLGKCPCELSPADLRDRFKREFGARRMPSLRQYLAKGMGLVGITEGKLVLTKKGQREFQKLSSKSQG